MSATARAVCVTTSVALRRTLRRTFHATGTAVEFFDAAAGSDPVDAVVVIDQETHATLSDADRELLTRGRALIVMGGSLEEDQIVDALRRERWNHVIRDTDDPDDSELVVTSVKLASGDIFGLEKYLAWGVKVCDSRVQTYEGKREALIAVTASARDAGARRPTVARIESVVDELLMNAMYDAPVDAHGRPKYAIDRKAEITLAPDEHAVLRLATDGTRVVLQVRDRYGGLLRRHVVDGLARGLAGGEMDQSHGGAGLGMAVCHHNALAMFFDVSRGRHTEVTAMIELDLNLREVRTLARSLHLFDAVAGPQ